MSSPTEPLSTKIFTYTVLIVGRSSNDRELYRHYLLEDTQCCYTLLEAFSAADALSKCQKHPIDGILVDSALPDTSGFDFVHSLQMQLNGKHPPIVMVERDQDVATAVRAIKLGAEDYLVRQTLAPEQLQLAMRQAIEQAQPRHPSPYQEEQLHIQQLNRDLANRVEELQTLIEIAPVGIAIAPDPSCAHMHHNAYLRQWLGVSPGHNISKSAPVGEQPSFQVLQNGEEVLPENLPMQMAARLGIDVRDTELEIVWPDGTTRQLLSYATPLQGDQNEIRGVVGAFLDITDRKQIEAELRSREEQLQLFIKHVPAGVAMFDREMHYIVASDRWLTSYGLEKQEIIGRSHYEIFPDLPDRWKEIHQRCLAGAVEACDEDPFPRANGFIDWVRWEIHPWYTSNNEIGGIVVFSEVITERKQAEIRLQEREATIRQQFAELESIYVTAPVGLGFVNSNLQFVRINERLAEIDGVSVAEHLGRTPHEVVPELADQIEPLYQQVLQTGEPILNIGIHGRTQAQPSSERDWVASYYPLKDGEGQVLGVNAVVQDITDIQQAQAEREQLLRQLNMERSFLEQTLQQMPLGVAIAEIPSGRLLFHNDEAIQLLGHPMRTSETYEEYTQYGAIDPDGQPYAPGDYPIARAVLTGEVVKSEEMKYRRGDGTETIFSVSAAPIVDPSGNRIAAVSTFEDISDRKHIEAERTRLLAEAEAANRSKDEFVALVAHELRSPLNAISGWEKLLQTRQFDPPTTQKALETIVRNTQAQVQLVEDLLDVSRMARGTLQLTVTPINLLELVKTAVETVRPTADANGLELEIQLRDIASISGDLHRLQQVVLNLLTNAIKFTPAGGRVKVVLDQVDSQAELKIYDTGKGINAEFLPYIFDRFRQDQQNTTAKQGLGLGLAIVKYLVEMHHGYVIAESAGEGQGTTFTVRLPLQKSDVITAWKPANAGKPESDYYSVSPQKSLQDIRVLVVDDEPDVLNFVAFVLEEYGAVVQTAINAPSALEQLRHFQPNILLSDIAMPEQNGYELLQQVRSQHPEGQIPAIALTAYAGKARREQSLQAGFQQHLTKPVEPKQLIAALLTVLGEEATS